MNDETHARHIEVRGHVQGVFFRSTTEDLATERGLAGWVRNNPDGTVEAWLEGDANAIGEVEEWMRQGGPPRARVEAVTAEDVAPRGFEGFEVGGPPAHDGP